VENAFFRYKSSIGESLHSRSPGGQGTEAVVACNILNQMPQRGRPASYAIGGDRHGLGSLRARSDSCTNAVARARNGGYGFTTVKLNILANPVEGAAKFIAPLEMLPEPLRVRARFSPLEKFLHDAPQKL